MGTKIDAAVNWAVKIADTGSHGYTQDPSARWGPDYDCSSFVISAWEYAGIKVKSKGASYTGNMKQAFTQLGFKDVTSSITLSNGIGLRKGDVLVSSSHAAMMISDTQLVEARYNEFGGIYNGRTGDQTGKEICTGVYYNNPWAHVLRYARESVSTDIVDTLDYSKYVGKRLANFSNSKIYNNTNGIVGQCVWYVYCRTIEKSGKSIGIHGNANEWWSSAKSMGLRTSASPISNSIACFNCGTYGHVIFVENVTGNTVYYTECNTPANNILDANDGILKKTTVSSFKSMSGYQGCIVLNGSFSEYVDPALGVSAAVAELIDPENFNPYMITINRSTGNVNYSALQKIGVVGALVEAGYLYDSAHREQRQYRNPKLHDQMAALQKAKMPAALYAISRAHTTQEAKKEVYELSFWIRRYTPLLGVWLSLSLTKSKSVNNKIVDVYYEEFVRLGLKGQIGFYVTRSQLAQIDWEKYSEEWFLWLISPASSATIADDLLTPQFFVL